MSEENVEVVRKSVEAGQRGDLDAAFESLDSEIEWEETEGLGPDAAVYRGKASVRGAVESWLGMWNDYTGEVERYIDAGDDVVVLVAERGRGRSSGVAVDRELGLVHTVRGNKIIRSRLFGSWDEALEAAGLRE